MSKCNNLLHIINEATNREDRSAMRKFLSKGKILLPDAESPQIEFKGPNKIYALIYLPDSRFGYNYAVNFFEQGNESNAYISDTDIEFKEFWKAVEFIMNNLSRLDFSIPESEREESLIR